MSSEPAQTHRPWTSARARPLADLDASSRTKRANSIGHQLAQSILVGRLQRWPFARCASNIPECHDLLAKLVVAGLCSQFGKCLPNIARLYLTAISGGHRFRWLAARRDPELCGIELKQTRRLRSRVTKLEPQFDGIELG